MRVRVVERAGWVTPGEMIVIDNTRTAAIGYDPLPFLDVEDEPERIVICDPSDGEKVREAIGEDSQLELVE